MLHYNDELYHHGILGQKWGVRRYQNPDGTLTNAGRKRLTIREANKIAKKAAKDARREYNESPEKHTLRQYAKHEREAGIEAVRNAKKAYRSSENESRKLSGRSSRKAIREQKRNEYSKKVSNMSDADLQKAINRLQLEKRYSELDEFSTNKLYSESKRYVNYMTPVAAAVAVSAVTIGNLDKIIRYIR